MRRQRMLDAVAHPVQRGCGNQLHDPRGGRRHQRFGAFTLTATVPPPGTPPLHPTQTSPTMPSLPTTPARTTGPDVTVGNLIDTAYYGGGTVWMADKDGPSTATDVYSYATGTDSWNIGDVPVEWQASNPLHPVIGQQMYRQKNGRFEQIGISWLKHGFSSTNSGGFPDMGSCDGPPNGSTQLGVNCSDAYGSGLNGGRSYLGPRFDVNPSTGVYTYPWTGLVGTYSNTDPIARRIVVSLDDVRGDTNAGAFYYVDCQYTTQDNAQWGNANNNFSSRLLKADTLFNSSVTYFGNTYRRTTALELWARMDNAVTVTPVDLVESTMTVTDKWRHWTTSLPDAAMLPSAQWVTMVKPQNTRFLVASKAIANGNGTWDYEYAVMNLNSNRAAGTFGVRVPVNAGVANIGFHAPKYHSGERVLNTPWMDNQGDAGKMVWSVDPASRQYTVPGMSQAVTFGPNALMWGTLYNFRFTSSAAPNANGVARLGLYRAPNATGYQGTSIAATGVKVPTICVADVGSQGGLSGPDGALDNNDFIAFISAYFNGDMMTADVGKTGGVDGPDNTLDNNDFIAYINSFFNGCV
ncbi:MAG: GC-type dockerin domain-anchored protein [Phycisphaerales bacterium]